jgi:3',5'-cyclic AMP phosphodiesterase CpdA
MPGLRFRSNGQFTIVQFTDIHWRNGDAADERTRALMDRVLDAERPDLVVLSGDVIDGATCSDPGRSWRDAVAPIEQRAIPWAAVFGNHDDEGSMNREQLMAVQLECDHCLSKPGPTRITGVGNYTLKIRSAGSRSTAAVLYFLDSGGNATDAEGYTWIMRDQMSWYRKTAARTQPTKAGSTNSAGEPLPALLFFHIPIPEYDDVWQRGGCNGTRREPVCCPGFNSGLFTVLCDVGDVLGVFVGHDHLNDYDGDLHGIRLCYGRATGYNGYGEDDYPRGARMIRLMEGKRSFDTWTRLDEVG